jgi:hypothetical protein
MTTSEQKAIDELAKQLEGRGWTVTIMPRTSRQGDVHAVRDGVLRRFECKGMAARNGVWLKRRQIDAVHGVSIVIGDEAWVLTPAQAHERLAFYEADFIERNKRPPKAPGWNRTQFPAVTGWAPLDRILA